MADPRTAFNEPTTVEARRTSFGALASTYDAVRPRWPEPTVHWLLAEPDAPIRVLDLGAGTGLGTRTIASLGHEVAAVVGTPEMVWDAERQMTTPGIGPAQGDGFEAPEHNQFGLEQTVTVDELVRLASSWSPVAVREDRDSVLDRVRALGTEVADGEPTLVFA